MAKSKQTKSGLVNYVYENSAFDLKDVSKCVNMFLTALSDSLGNGEVVELRGFGTFEVKPHKGRRAFDFKTGEIRQNHDYCSVVFKPGKALKEKLHKEHHEKDC